MNVPPNTFLNRLRSAWNVFLDRENRFMFPRNYGSSYSIPQFRPRLSLGTERSIVSAIYNRVAIDVSSIKMRHARVDENESYLSTVDSGLNHCLDTEANIDQTNRDFIRDLVMSLFDEGSIAIVPVDMSVSMLTNNSFDILTMRTGKILQWHPHHVRVLVYNDSTGEKEELTLPKTKVGIVENPLFAVMNERNSILQRLISKLNLLDVIDEQTGSGKLDIIIQFPYVIKGDARKIQAENRRKEMEAQLRDSKYGVAYADGTEKITQLNRPAENNLMAQIEYLTRMLYSQLGISEAIFNGTADQKELLNYYNRTIEPVSSAITGEMTRKFLTQTARSQGQVVMHFKNTFGFVTTAELPELADKLTRNEILSSNEMRAVIGYTPSAAPGANDLRNKNLPNPDTKGQPNQPQQGIDVTNELKSLSSNK